MAITKVSGFHEALILSSIIDEHVPREMHIILSNNIYFWEYICITVQSKPVCINLPGML